MMGARSLILPCAAALLWGTLAIGAEQRQREQPVPSGRASESVSTLPPKEQQGETVRHDQGRRSGKHEIASTDVLGDKRTPGMVHRLEGHEGSVTGVAFSPDGRMGVTASEDGAVRLWDLDLAEEIGRLPKQREQIQAVAYSPDGRLITFGGSHKTIRFWDHEAGKMAREINVGATIGSLAFSSDGRRLAAGCGDGTVLLIDMEAVEERQVVQQPMDFVQHVAFSSDGKLALCAGGYYANSDAKLGPMLRVWNVKTGKVVFELKPAIRTALRSAAFSPDGRWVIAADVDDRRRAVIWDLATGEPVGSSHGTDGTDLVAFASTESCAVVANGRGAIAFFDPKRFGSLSQMWYHRGPIRALAVSPDGRYALTGSSDKTAILWRLPVPPDLDERSPGEVHRFIHERYVYGVAFSPDGAHAFTTGADLLFRMWDVTTGELLQEYRGKKAHDIFSDVAISPDGRYALLAAGQSRGTHGVSLWDIGAWREVRRYPGHEAAVRRVAFLPDGRTALSGDNEGFVFIWETLTGRQIGRYQAPVRSLRSLAVSADGRLAVYAGGREDLRLRVWDVKTGRETHVLPEPGGEVVAAAFSPDGRRLFSAGRDRAIRTWELDSEKEIASIVAPEQITCAAFSANGRLAAVGDTSAAVYLLDLETGAQLHAFLGHTERVSRVVFSPDGRYVLSASSDCTARLWAVPKAVRARTRGKPTRK